MTKCNPVLDSKLCREEVEEDHEEDLVLLVAKYMALAILDRGLTSER